MGEHLKKSFYSRISPLSNPDLSLVLVLDQWVEERKNVRDHKLHRIIRDLCLQKRYKRALEVDLIGKVHGLESAETYLDNMSAEEKIEKMYGVLLNWNKQPEFTAWLAEIKWVNLESIPNWEEKQMFKEFMEDQNTATFPSKKYYNIDAYYRRKMEKEMKTGSKKTLAT